MNPQREPTPAAQREFDEHLAEIYWMNAARDSAAEPADPPLSPLDAEWREVNRQLDWRTSVEKARAARLRRPMAEVPDSVNLAEILAVLGGDS